MSDVERNKRLAREWYTLLGSGRYEEAKKFVSEDFEFFPMIDERLVGVDAFIKLESSHMDPQPGFRFDVIQVIGEGDLVAVHFIHDGWLPENVDEYIGLKATRKHSHHDVMTWLQFTEDGKIRRKWAKYNMFYVLKQLGVPEIMALDGRINGTEQEQ